jgi:fibronectin type 3 domain-containing protein
MKSAYNLPIHDKQLFSRLSTQLFFSLTLSIFIFQMLSASAFSAQVTLAWDPNTDSDTAGYKLYYGEASGSYSQVIDVGDTTSYTVTNLTNGNTYYFTSTAYDATGNESEHSNEVIKTLVQQYTLTASTSGTGTGTITGTGISCSNICLNTYNAGTIVTLTATPDAGATFTGWSGGACTGSGQCVFNMNATKSVTALFKSNTFTITAKNGTGGSISPAGAVSVKSGSSQTFTITPISTYRIANVIVDRKSVGVVTNYTFNNVKGNHTITVTFKRR